MLKLEYDNSEINIKFDHKWETITRFNKVLNREIGTSRRCTYVRIIFPYDNLEFHGQATCHPYDNFCKSMGRKIALANAMIGFNRDLRKVIWQEYHRHCK